MESEIGFKCRAEGRSTGTWEKSFYDTRYVCVPRNFFVFGNGLVMQGKLDGTVLRNRILWNRGLQCLLGKARYLITVCYRYFEAHIT